MGEDSKPKENNNNNNDNTSEKIQIVEVNRSNMADHNSSHVVLVVVNTILFGLAAALIHLWGFPDFAADIYKYSFRNLTLTYEIPVTPSHWVDLLWPIIFAWLLLCKLYTWVLLCRKNPVGPSYKSPPVVAGWFFLYYSLALFCLIAWTIVWDRELAIAATVLIGVAAIFCWLATAVLYKSVHEFGPWMARHSKADLWLYRIFWHNGMAALTTWLTINAIYSIAIVLRIEAGLDLQHIVYIVLGSISGLMIIWFILENTVADRFGRYTVTPYLIVIVLMVGVFDRQYEQNSSKESDYFIATLLGVSCLCAVVRLILVIVRGIKTPLYGDNKVSDDPVLSFRAE